jgi:hypothetical protein
MARRLVALDKCPGVRPIGVGKTWRRLAAKATLLVSGCDAKERCGINQLCAGLEAGIEGVIHVIDKLWRQHKEEEEWGFLLLVDAANAFNELNWTAMLWTIRQEWPSGARFAFNCYCHWATLVIHGKGGTVVLIFSKGDLLSMFGYGIGILPLIRRLKIEFPAVKQPWYANDAGTGGSCTDLRKLFLRRTAISRSRRKVSSLSEPTTAPEPSLPLTTLVSRCKRAAATLAATSAPKPAGSCGSRRRSLFGPVR